MEIQLIKKKLQNRLKKLISNPDMFVIYIESKIVKKHLFKKYVQKSVGNGLQKLYFTISFDCDTEMDIKVIGGVVNRLLKMNITPVIAVPGELLLKGKEEYREVFTLGAEFLNHGYKTHSIKTKSGYESVLDYCELSEEDVEMDIVRGDQVIKEVFGKPAIGFRTPHFGNFQEKRQFELLYSKLNRMGYRYSTSTIPYFGLKMGAAYYVHGLIEIPVTGMISEPLRILDSFYFYDNENDCLREQDYRMGAVELVDFYKDNVKAGLINIYADPSQIYQSDGFFEFMNELNQIAINITYEKLLEEMK